jgi:hypothetical protein
MNLSTDISPEMSTKSVEFPLIDISTGDVYSSAANWIAKNSGVSGSNEAERTAQFKFKPYQVDYPTKLLIKTGFYLPDSVAGTEDMEFPVNLQYSAFANPMDYYVRFSSQFGGTFATTPLLFTINKEVVFEKQRYALFDTLVPKETIQNYNVAPDIWAAHDPLEEMVRVSNEYCANPGPYVWATMYFPPNYYFKLSSPGNLLCLYKASIFSNLATNLDRGYTETQIYCFDFENIPSGCTYDLSNLTYGNPYGSNITKPAGPAGMSYTVYPVKTGSVITYTWAPYDNVIPATTSGGGY